MLSRRHRSSLFLCLFFISLFLWLGALSTARAQEVIPRTLLAVYSSKDSTNPRFSPAHLFLEMPANRLGFELHHVDVEQPLPALNDDVRGIVVWLIPGRNVSNPDAWLSWLEAAMAQGKKVMVMGNLGIDHAYRQREGGMERLNRVMAHLGVRDLNSYNSVTYEGKIVYQNSELIGFERSLPDALAPYQATTAIPGIGVSHLKVEATKNAEMTHDLVVTSAEGGYAASGYVLFEGYPLLPIVNGDKHPGAAVGEPEEEKADPVQQWYLNPFRFLQMVFGGEEDPKPDVTTLNGRRIFYSHIDGDGWNSVTEIRKYRPRNMLSSEVVYHEILKLYPDIPVNVSIITAEMDKDCFGLSASAKVARKIFTLPNVEPSSHTHSHPLFWGYFEDGDVTKEISILNRYPPRPRRHTMYSMLFGEREEDGWEPFFKKYPELRRTTEGGFEKFLNRQVIGELTYNKYYETPRSYACSPFNLDEEISGSVARIKKLVPKKRVRLMQWSGDTRPFEEVLRKTREAGLFNINGGDSRFDSEFPSYASVSPIGLRVGNEQQIYSSNSNENTYTNLWTDRFFGFIYLQKTVMNTEMPMRVQPFNIYFHMYSGAKQASLAALKANFDFARRQDDIIRILASDFAAIANGFYSTRMIREGEGVWRIYNRGYMNTFRFDRATLKTVDFVRSKGVLGQRYFQGSLYVMLDPRERVPRLALKDKDLISLYPSADTPYLIESSWLIKGLISVKNSLMFEAEGFGKGVIVFKFPESGTYDVLVTRNKKTIEKQQIKTDKEGMLRVSLATDAYSPTEISISKHEVEMQQ